MKRTKDTRRVDNGCWLLTRFSLDNGHCHYVWDECNEIECKVREGAIMVDPKIAVHVFMSLIGTCLFGHGSRQKGIIFQRKVLQIVVAVQVACACSSSWRR